MAQKTATTAVVKQKVRVDLNAAIAVRSKDGTMVMRLDRDLVFSEEEGTLVKMSGMGKKVGGRWMDLYIKSADGWTREGAACGLQIHQPDTVIVHGHPMPNGYQDPNTGKIYCRAMAGGRTDIGLPFKTDRTIIYDVTLYILVDLLAKAKQDNYRAYFKMRPKGAESPGESWGRYDIDEAFDLWVNSECPDFFKWAGEAKNRIKMCERTALTFAVRNAIKAHPAVSSKNKFYTDTTIIRTHCWREEGGKSWEGSMWDVDTTKLLEAGGGKTIEVDSKVEDITELARKDDDLRAEIAAEAGADLQDETDAQEDEDAPPVEGDDEPGAAEPEAEDEPKPDVKKDELLTNITKLRKFKATAYKNVCAKLSVDPKGDLSKLAVARLVEILDAVKVA